MCWGDGSIGILGKVSVCFIFVSHILVYIYIYGFDGKMGNNKEMGYRSTYVAVGGVSGLLPVVLHGL